MGDKKAKADKSRHVRAAASRPALNFRLEFSDLWENPELVLTNMASSMRAKAAKAIPEFFLGKFAYVQALSLFMLLAERALKVEKYPPMHPYVIYTVGVICVLAGALFSFKMQIKYAALMYAMVLAYLSINAYTNVKFNYSRGVRNRISSRHLGCLGVYVIYAFIKSKHRSLLLHRVGELCVAVYLSAQAYMINESYEDKKAVLDLVPGGNYARYVITLIFGCAALCFLSGYFLKDISMSMVFLLVILTIIVDLRFWFWMSRGMTYWNQVRLVIDNINLIAGFTLFIGHYENMSKADYNAIQEAHEQQASRDHLGADGEGKEDENKKDQ